MNPLTLEWIDKAEGDWITAGRELRARVRPNFDAACFHAQQSAEKYLKAVLQEYGQPVPRTHNLLDLMAICLKIEASYGLLRADLLALDPYAVRFRYPGEIADRAEARQAWQAAKAVRQFTRSKLGLQD